MLSDTCNCCDDNRNGTIDEGIKYCNQAGPFGQLSCDSIFETQVPYEADSRSFLARFASNLALYASGLDFFWRLFVNDNVTTVALNLAEFQTSSWDHLSIGQESWGGTPGAGGPALGWHYVQGWLDHQIDMVFSSDYDGNGGRGFRFSGAAVRCAAASQAPTVRTIYPLQRNEGLLLRTGDTLHFRVDSTASEAHTVWVVMERGASTTADFDLFARRGAMPEKHLYDYRAISTATGDVMAPPQDASSTSWYIAVTSYSGAGSFRLWVSRAKPSQIRTLTAGVATPQSSQTVTGLQDTLRAAMRMNFGTTEGMLVVNEIVFSNQGECTCSNRNCNICFTNVSNSHCTYLGDQIRTAPSQWTNVAILTHEMGHCVWGLDDEYDGLNVCGVAGRRTCGHSIMNGPVGNTTNYCTQYNHRVDSDPAICLYNCYYACGQGCSKCWVGPSASWPLHAPRVLDMPIGTLDDTDFSTIRSLDNVLILR